MDSLGHSVVRHDFEWIDIYREEKPQNVVLGILTSRIELEQVLSNFVELAEFYAKGLAQSILLKINTEKEVGWVERVLWLCK